MVDPRKRNEGRWPGAVDRRPLSWVEQESHRWCPQPEQGTHGKIIWGELCLRVGPAEREEADGGVAWARVTGGWVMRVGLVGLAR
jgi:hypothetical protein